MINLSKKFCIEWLSKLKDSWQNKNIKNAVSLFESAKFYQETPFHKPYTSLSEIEREWQHIKNENIRLIDLAILAIDRNVLIAKWYLEQNDDVFDGIYEIKFDDNLNCVYFKSWEMKKKL